MSVPWAKRLSGRADVYGFPVTRGPLMLLLPNRAGTPVYGQPRPSVMFMQPPASVIPPLPPPPAPPRPPVQPITITYRNASQTCVSTCPDGTSGNPISVTIPADQPEYNSTESQAAANAAAMAAACAEAAAQRALDPCDGAQVQTSFSSDTRNCLLVGFSEILTPSTPPKKYLACQFTGVLTGDPVRNISGGFPTYPCNDGPILGTYTHTYGGEARIDPLTMTWTYGVDTVVEYPTVGPPNVFYLELTGPYLGPPIEYQCLGTWTRTNTTVTYEANGDCCVTGYDFFGFPLFSHVQRDGFFVPLIDEDTEASAIARASSGAGDLNVAKYEARVTTFNFLWQSTMLTLNCMGLTPGSDYKVTVPIVTSDYDGSNPVGSDVEYDFTASGTSELITDLYTALRGKRVTVGNGTIQLVP